MILLLLIFQITNQMTSTRIRSKESQTMTAYFPDNTVKTATGQNTVINLNMTDAYDVDLYDEDDELIETPYLSLDNLKLEHLEIDNQCIGFPKHPQLTELMDYKLPNSTSNLYFTDILTIPDYKNLYLVTQDLLLIQLQLNTQYWIATQAKNIIDIKSLLNLTDTNIRTNALFSCPHGYMSCLLVSSYGGFWVSKFLDFDDRRTDATPQYEATIKKRKEIYQIATQGDRLAIAAGEEGVDIYRFANKTGFIIYIYFSCTLSRAHMELSSQSEINIIGVQFYNNLLYVLDDIYGVFVFDVSNAEQPVLLMKISIPRTVAFDIWGSTLIVIAETTNNLQYMLEIFINLNENTYYVNRVYVDGFSFRDIKMNYRYAFLIGEDAHMVIKHSIFNGFVKNNKELVRTFFLDSLIKFDLYSTQYEQTSSRYNETSYYVGLSRKAIHVWKFNDYHAFVLCNFDSNVQKDFQLKVNASYCQYNDQAQQYQQCQASFKMTVIANGSVIESDQLLTIIVSVSVAGFILILIIVAVGLRWKGFIRNIRDKREQLKQLQQYGHFQEVGQKD